MSDSETARQTVADSRSDFSQQGFELGEDLLDRVEVGGAFLQEDEAGSDVTDRHFFSLQNMRSMTFRRC